MNSNISSSKSDDSKGDDVDYDALEERLTDPDYPVTSAGQVETAESAEAAGRAWVVREYGSVEAVEAELHRGRPRVGETRGASPTLRGRVTEAEHAAFKRLQQTTGRTQSELVREAVHDLLAKHKLVS